MLSFGPLGASVAVESDDGGMEEGALLPLEGGVDPPTGTSRAEISKNDTGRLNVRPAFFFFWNHHRLRNIRQDFGHVGQCAHGPSRIRSNGFFEIYMFRLAPLRE